MTETLKQNKQALIYGLVLVALVIAYFKRDTIKDFFSKSSSTSNTATSTPSVSSNSINEDSILSKGSTGKQVQQLQELLNIKHSNNKPQIIPFLVEDGNFGAATESMLKKWTGKTSISINQLIKALK